MLPEWTPEQVARRLTARWPELSGLPVAPLGEGSDHRAYAVGSAWVFRVPKYAGQGGSLIREARLLAWLDGCLPLPVPRPRFVAEPSDVFPEGIVGATRLTGRSGLEATLPDGLGHALGAFLRVLHGLDEVDSGLPVDHDPLGAEWQDAALADLDIAVQAGLLARPEPWAAVLAASPPLDLPRLSVIHGDFAAEHVLLGPAGTVTGVIDWTDAALGDPARDLAGLIHWGGRALLNEALDGYGAVEAAMVRRAAWFALCRALADLAFGVQEERSEYVRGGLAALAHLSASFATELDVPDPVDKPAPSP